ncbi:O-methyltransferase [Nostoc sp.]|uniref:O-methyltransferase n=1 Tax=Nostoc sp. TaxID=1180 RepID=UPI002FF58081
MNNSVEYFCESAPNVNNVSPNQGKLLMLLALIHKAHTILEIGTLGGYSTIWLARALPVDGHLIALESNPKHAEVARAGLGNAPNVIEYIFPYLNHCKALGFALLTSLN